MYPDLEYEVAVTTGTTALRLGLPKRPAEGATLPPSLFKKFATKLLDAAKKPVDKGGFVAACFKKPTNDRWYKRNMGAIYTARALKVYGFSFDNVRIDDDEMFFRKLTASASMEHHRLYVGIWCLADEPEFEYIFEGQIDPIHDPRAETTLAAAMKEINAERAAAAAAVGTA